MVLVPLGNVGQQTNAARTAIPRNRSELAQNSTELLFLFSEHHLAELGFRYFELLLEILTGRQHGGNRDTGGSAHFNI
jgi:hypothetical protein